MSAAHPRRMSMPAHRTFGTNESALDVDNDDEPSIARRVLSFGQQHRPSFTSRWRNSENLQGELPTPTTERPPIPTMMQPAGEIYTTPLPVLSMIVLSIVRSFHWALIGN